MPIVFDTPFLEFLCWSLSYNTNLKLTNASLCPCPASSLHDIVSCIPEKHHARLLISVPGRMVIATMAAHLSRIHCGDHALLFPSLFFFSSFVPLFSSVLGVSLSTNASGGRRHLDVGMGRPRDSGPSCQGWCGQSTSWQNLIPIHPPSRNSYVNNSLRIVCL